jgi:hypothetical protein
MVIGVGGSPIRTKQGRVVAVANKEGRAATMVAEEVWAAVTSEVSEVGWETNGGSGAIGKINILFSN